MRRPARARINLAALNHNLRCISCSSPRKAYFGGSKGECVWTRG